MKITIYIFFILFPYLSLFSQGNKVYESAYCSISDMLLGNAKSLSFKKAVFATENAYQNNLINVDDFDMEIENLSLIVNIMSNSDVITYDEKDKEIILKHAVLFKTLTDTIAFPLDSTHFFVHTPYTYNFDDPLGQEDWSNMFVSTLLETGKGNCHSLPYLYKILSDELGIPCYLAFAPNHIYIKLFSEQTGWYNTELTSGTFPVDAWIMASGYINTDAIRNGLYMDTLSTKQAVANCLVDLAHGYQNKFGRENPDFVIKCCNTVLEYHPVNVNAMLTKAEAQKYYIDMLMKQQNTTDPEDLFTDTSVAEMYSDMEQTYVQLHQLGYRRMPEEMYLEWIGLLKNEPNIYLNKNFKK